MEMLLKSVNVYEKLIEMLVNSINVYDEEKRRQNTKLLRDDKGVLSSS